MSRKDTVINLLSALDSELVWRNSGLKKIEDDYPSIDGKIPSIKYSEYKNRKDKLNQLFEKKWLSLLIELNELCKQIRSKQPDLCDLTKEHLNINSYLPRNLVFGRINVKYENIDIFVPREIEFPFKKAFYISNEKHNTLIHRLLLRLMFALPVGKIEINIFDPNGLGISVDCFRDLFSIESIFPNKKVASSQPELKNMLLSALDYCETMVQKIFSKDCNSWSEYNRVRYSQGVDSYNKLLPFKVFTFFGIPSGIDSECFEMIRKLTKNAEKLGILVIFSFDLEILENDKNYSKSLIDNLRNYIQYDSVSLHSIIQPLASEYKYITIKETPEIMPDSNKFHELLNGFIETLTASKSSQNSFFGLMGLEKLFNNTSEKVLSIPLGFSTQNGETISLDLGDNPPHTLIGGTTGSGKSNLLHILILSACCRFSPEELNIYLLDFKEGVEFSVYAKYKLPHARLVATEADTEYGVSVLEHLVKENIARYNLFKKNNVNNISEYRKLNQNNKLPRILLVIDEFQVLLSGLSSAKASEHFSTLAKQGRACGIHIVMATQTLAGLDFNAIGTQFGGRIALKSSEDDSKKLLGGLNNDAASKISVPFAILNTSAGSVAGNIKFAIPYADSTKVRDTINTLFKKCEKSDYGFKTKIFEGMILPFYPEQEKCLESRLRYKLGEVLSFESEKFVIEPARKPYNNILFCGNEQKMTTGFLYSILMSSVMSTNIQKVIYIGSNLSDSLQLNGKIEKYESLQSFLEVYKDNLFENENVVILDNVNATKEINYPQNSYPGQKLTEIQEVFKKLLDEGNQNGTFIVSFFDKFGQIKASGIPLDRFDFRIGYLLNDSDTGAILGTHGVIRKDPKSGRAFYAENGEIINWFKPYIGDEHDE